MTKKKKEIRRKPPVMRIKEFTDIKEFEKFQWDNYVDICSTHFHHTDSELAYKERSIEDHEGTKSWTEGGAKFTWILRVFYKDLIECDNYSKYLFCEKERFALKIAKIKYDAEGRKDSFHSREIVTLEKVITALEKELK